MIIKRKLLLFTAILVLTSLSYLANAQFYVGAEVGGNENYLITNVSNLISTEYVPINGFNIGVPVEYKVNDWFSLKSTPNFIQKNYQLQRTGFYQGVYQESKNGYLQIPVSAQFSFGGRALKGYLNLGGYGAYWASSHIKGDFANPLNYPAYGTSNTAYYSVTVFDYETPYYYDEKYQFNSTKDNRFEFGVYAGLGISYQVAKNYKVFTEFKYYDALTDQQKNYELEQVPRYNETGSISVGFLYQLKTKYNKFRNHRFKNHTLQVNN